MTHSSLSSALLGGLAGALTVTLLNEGVRRLVPGAPRMDVIGERGLRKTFEAVGAEPPKGEDLYRTAMLGDVVSNTVYYALVAAGKPETAVRRGMLLGLAAGIGAATLPDKIGLGSQPGARPPVTSLLTVAWYTAAGLAAGVVVRATGPKTGQQGQPVQQLQPAERE